MLDFNEEEIDRMHGKLHMLSICCDIVDLGFKYEEKDCVIIDIYAGEGGYGGPTEIEMLETIIRPTLGDGEIDFNYENIELLKSLSVEIPYSTYDEDSINGFFVRIDNYITKKFISYKLTPDENVTRAIKRMTDTNWYNESTVENTQVIFKDEGVYIVYPEEYVCLDEFLESYIWLLENMKKQVEDYEMNLEKEVA